MSSVKGLRIVIITAPDRLDQEWMGRLAGEADVERVERVGVLAGGIELVQQLRPDLVIVDRELDQAEDAIRAIFTSTPATVSIAVTPEPDMAALRRLVGAGARDVLSRPLKYTALLESIRSVFAVEHDRRERTLMRADAATSFGGRGRLVVVISPKGGVGTTTIAGNLAVALRQLTGGRVLLADFGMQFGDAGVHLNLWSRHTLEELIENNDEIDDAVLDGIIQQHSSGIGVLLGSDRPDLAAALTVERLTLILDRLLERHSYVVVDTWSFLDDTTLTLLGRADEVLVVTTPEVPALKNVKRFLDHMRQQGTVQGRITLALNRFPSVDSISLQDVQQHLRYPVGASIPSDGRLVTHSVNRGVPLMLAQPQSDVARSLLKLAAQIAGEQAASTLPVSTVEARQSADDAPTSRVKGYGGLLRLGRRVAS